MPKSKRSSDGMRNTSSEYLESQKEVLSALAKALKEFRPIPDQLSNVRRRSNGALDHTATMRQRRDWPPLLRRCFWSYHY